MIYLHTLGAALIHVGARHVLPSASRAFGSLLYLALDPGRAVPRNELQLLLFPEHGAHAGAHSLRQLLYRMRQLGAPIVSQAGSVSMLPGLVRSDFVELREAGEPSSQLLEAVGGGILPAYSPTFSRPYSDWVDAQRTRIMHGVRRALVGQLGQFRVDGRWRDLEPLARACLAIDPLNEEATLALAESLALSGQKAGAVRLLDSYLEEIGPYGKDLRIPAHVLRTRIHEHVPEPSFRRTGPGPFVGREAEMAELWRHYYRAKQGEASAVVIYGEPGIGKTRLATEFLKGAALDGATCVKVECAPHDVRRPLGVFVDLVPKLLDAPGGLGVAPEAMVHLARLTSHSAKGATDVSQVDAANLFGTIVSALQDLVDAICSEGPLVLHVEDANCMDALSVELLTGLCNHQSLRSFVVLMTSRDRLSSQPIASTAEATNWLRLRALDLTSATQLAESLWHAGRSGADERGVSYCVRMAAGNPLYLHWMVTQCALGEREIVPVPLGDLLARQVRQLDTVTLRVFVTTVLLGKYCSFDRIVLVAGLPKGTLLGALHALEIRGFLTGDSTAIRSTHPLLSQVALAEIPPLTKRLVHSWVATALEAEALGHQDTAMRWDAAEHWHNAGNTERAVQVLISCSQYALSIGQPIIACELLRRARGFTHGAPPIDLVKCLIAAARMAEDFLLVRQTIRELRALTVPPSGPDRHDELELLEFQANRFSGQSLLKLVPRLRRCVADPSAEPVHALRAACHLIAAADLNLDHAEASQVHSRVKSIKYQTTDCARDRLMLDVLYHSIAGSPQRAIVSGGALLDAARIEPDRPLGVRLMVDAAMVLFRCGACEQGVFAMEEAFTDGRKHGMSSSMIDAASMLAWMHWTMGRRTAFADWDRTSDEIFASRNWSFGRLSHYLSNKIEFAIDLNEPRDARHWLALAREQYAEIDAPRSRLIATAFQLRIRQIEGSPPSSDAKLKSLLVWHERGKRCGLHDNFVEALWVALCIATRMHEADKMLFDYVDNHRRDRFPLKASLATVISRRRKIAFDA